MTDILLIIGLTLFISWVLRTLETGLFLSFVCTLVLSLSVLTQTDSILLTLITWVFFGLSQMTDSLFSGSYS